MLNDNKIFVDKNEFIKFYELITDVEGGIKVYEFHRLDLSVKYKYVNPEQNIPKFKSTFIDQVSVYSQEKAIRALNKFEALKGIYTYSNTNSDNELLYPENAFAVYMSCNPSNGVLVYNNVKKFLDNIINKSIFSDNKGELHHFNKLQKIVLSEAHKSENKTKYFIDIDCDIDKNDEYQLNIIRRLLTDLDNNNVKYFIVESKNGYHIVMKKSTLKFNYNALIAEYHCILFDYVMLDQKTNFINKTYEIIVNGAGFIPVPGTMRNGFMVKIINAI